MLTQFAPESRHELTERALPLANSPELRASLEEAEPHTLLMVYVHLTHDEAMLDLFANHVRSPYANPPGEIPAEAMADLRARLLHVLTTPGAAIEEPLPDALMQRMMSVGVGELVEDEFLPLLWDQIGFKQQPRRHDLPGRPTPSTEFKVLVIGAGLTGIAAAVKLAEAGYDYVVIERFKDVSGVWWSNTYPGVGVDTPSHFYSLSFALSADWTHYHPRGADMYRYFRNVAENYGIMDNVRLETTVEKLVFDEAANIWKVTVKNADGTEEVIQANAVINGHGVNHTPRIPDIPGLDRFAGPVVHTAAWRQTDLKGKRVGVIGTGASAAQVIPSIVDDVTKLVVFQRTKHWVMSSPAGSDVVSEGVKYAMRHIPHYLEWYRFRIYWFAADGLYPHVVLDPDWPKDSPAVSATNENMWRFSMAHIENSFHDRPDLKAKLTPDFPVFSKRIVIDRGPYFQSYRKPNVTLEVEGIERVTPTGVELKDGTHHELDVLICATGFTATNMLADLEIVGRGGRRLRDEWGYEDARAYFGMTIPGYPNYFHVMGPNSAPNHAAGQNLVSERQVNYIIECLDWLQQSSAAAIEPSLAAYEAWNEKVDAKMKGMIWSHPKANSYYNNSKKRNYLSWPWRLVDLWQQTEGPNKEDFIQH